MIVLESLSRFYGQTAAVDDVSLEVRRGEIFSFLGMNGAGKTTTLKMIVGILRPTMGKVLIRGLDVQTHSSQIKRTIGYISDRPYLYSKLSANEFLKFISVLYGMDRKSAEEAIEEQLRHFELLHARKRLIGSFSHGMKQRLATCAAMLHRPEILVVDEPMVGLDPRGAKLMKATLKAYAQRGGTVFLSTHSLDVAEEISHRIGIIHRGQLAAEGTVGELRTLTGVSSLEDVFLAITGSSITEDHEVDVDLSSFAPDDQQGEFVVV